MDDVADIAVAFEAAHLDPAVCAAREACCRGIASELSSLGKSLWIAGWMFRDDRANGLAVLVRTAGELAESTVLLLDERRFYAAAALLRQLVEVEYLAWAFADDLDEAGVWLTTDDRERRRLFQPARMRERSAGHFRDNEYAVHCSMGGHPHPNASPLLPDSSRTMGENAWLWGDLANHLARLWRSLLRAVIGQGWETLLR